MRAIEDILANRAFSRSAIVRLLDASLARNMAALRGAAADILRRELGSGVSFRGLLEFSNRCRNDCYYCGLRAADRKLGRYTMSRAAMVAAARACARAGYGSMVLQAGERTDADFVRLVESSVRAIKRATRSTALPRGLGITLCVGEQSPDTYRRFFDAGAHRYLLRIETSNPRLFARLHPPGQSFKRRLACLRELRRIGYQVGTGVMIGLPGQTVAMLADDVLFFRELDVDMLGMGPYLLHARTPLAGAWPARAAFAQTLRMIAVCRIVLRTVNIAATTALQAVDPEGRERGLEFGANVIMPNITPQRYRRQYRLYDGKPCLNESPADCRACLAARIMSIGRTVIRDAWGDAPHAIHKQPA